MIHVLDKGHIRLVDKMGDDAAIVQAARVSYGDGTKTVREDEKLIRFLMAHNHTSPFEQVEFKFHVKMPIFVARQWVRHRTASINEVSARYSELSDEWYVPELEQIQPQSKSNKQGREDGDGLTMPREAISEAINETSRMCHEQYKMLLASGLSREIARSVLPVNTYTEWYWKANLHNIFHFLKLRMDSHAQYEIRVYANAMFQLIQPHVPVACAAFEDFKLAGDK